MIHQIEFEYLIQYNFSKKKKITKIMNRIDIYFNKTYHSGASV